MQHQFLIILGFPPLKLDKVINFLRSRGVDFIRIPLYDVLQCCLTTNVSKLPVPCSLLVRYLNKPADVLPSADCILTFDGIPSSPNFILVFNHFLYISKFSYAMHLSIVGK